MKWLELLWPLLLFAAYVGLNYLLKIASSEQDRRRKGGPALTEAKKQAEAFLEQAIKARPAPREREASKPRPQVSFYNSPAETTPSPRQAVTVLPELERIKAFSSSILIEKQKRVSVGTNMQSVLQDPSRLKEAFVLREVLSRPLACRAYRNRREML